MKVILADEGGKLAYFLAKRFASKGYDVSIIDPDYEHCVELSRALDNTTVICGDGSDPRILEDAGAAVTDVFVALNSHDAQNLLMCQIAGQRFGVPKTLALVNDPGNEIVFKKLGVGGIFSPIDLIGSLVEQKITFDDITNLIPIEEGKVTISEIHLKQGVPAVKYAIRDIPALPQDAVIACIFRGDKVVIPRGKVKMEENDRVLLITLPESLGAAIKALTGGRE